MENKIAQGKSHGKIILMGEHAVVYGEPSIALPFPAVEMTASVKGTKGALLIDCSYYHGIANEMPEVLQSLRTAIETALTSLGKPHEKLMVTIDSSIPPERGMGSSAAVAVAVTRAIYHYFSKDLTHNQLLELVDISEKVAHGNPSGLDAVTTSGDSPVFFRKGQPFIPFNLKMDAYLVVGDTGKTGQTKDAVQSIADRINNGESKETLKQIRALGKLAEQAKTNLEHNEPSKLGAAMDQAHDILTALGVSSEELNQLVSTARQFGALGAKLTGGGRGGCMIALTKTKEDAERVRIALLEAGAINTWVTHFRQEEN